MTTDEQLLEAWRAGDSGAGDELLRRHFKVVSRFFVNKVGDAAEDLIQATFMRCVEGQSRFDGRSTFRTYLFGIARFVLYEYFRRKQKSGAVDFGVTSILALDPTPSQIVAKSDERKIVLEALRGIPLDQQVALELYYWENMSIDDLSVVLEVPVGTVKSRLYYGRQALQKSIGPAGTNALTGSSGQN